VRVCVALTIRQAMRFRHIIICGMCRLYSIFLTLSHFDTIFGKTLLNIKCLFWFYLQRLSVTFLILWRTERDMIIRVYRSPCKVPIIRVRFKRNLNFVVRFSNNTQISNFMKIYRVEAELFRANGQTRGWTDTDLTKLIIALRNFAKGLKSN